MEFCFVIYTTKNGPSKRTTSQCRSNVLLFIRAQPNTYFINKYFLRTKQKKKKNNDDSKPIHALHRRLIFIGFVRLLFRSSHHGMPLSLLVVSRANENNNLLDISLSEKRSFQLYIMFITQGALWARVKKRCVHSIFEFSMFLYTCCVPSTPGRVR